MSEWISVKDRLPKERDIVIAGSSSKKSICCNVYCLLSDDGSPVWNMELYNGSQSLLMKVTHWMPKPKPPKERK